LTLVDTNVLIYATFVDAPEHERARAWLVDIDSKRLRSDRRCGVSSPPATRDA